MFPPSGPPGYYAPDQGYPPGGGMAPPGPAPIYPQVPLGAPIAVPAIPPGRDPVRQLQDLQSGAGQSKPDQNPLVMSADGDTAFATENSAHPEGLVFILGGMGLQRNRLPQSAVAYKEPASTMPGTSTYPTQPQPQILGDADIDPRFNWGFRGTLGYHFGDQAVELVGWKIWGGQFLPGRCRQGQPVPAVCGFPPPLGIGGGGNNANTWLQVDQVRILDVTDLANVEANYRIGVGSGFEFLLGLRYLNVSERFDILSDQDGLTVTARRSAFRRSRIACRRTATSSARRSALSWATIRSSGWRPACSRRLMGGINFYSVDVSVFRGDGFTALNNNATTPPSAALTISAPSSTSVPWNTCTPGRLRTALDRQRAGRQFRGGLQHRQQSLRLPSRSRLHPVRRPLLRNRSRFLVVSGQWSVASGQWSVAI